MGTLRLLLAISVVLAHAGGINGFRLVTAQVAVQAFYIISGFYMAMILQEKYTGKGAYKLFISNRFLRLYPIYWVVLLGAILYSLAKANHAYLGIYLVYWKSMGLGSFLLLVFTNIFIFFQDILMFMGLDPTTGKLFFTTNFRETAQPLYQFLLIPQAWTIGVELSFYLIAPFIAKWKNIYIIVLVLFSFLLRLYLASGLNLVHDPWTYRFFPTELVFFLAGILAYRGYQYLQQLQIKGAYLQTIWFGILLFTALFSFLPNSAYHHFIVKDWLYLLALFIALPFIFMLTSKWKFDQYVGELSYPVYISHLLVLKCILDGIGPLNAAPVRGTATVTVSIILAIALNELVQKRIEKIRQQRILKNKKSQPAQTA